MLTHTHTHTHSTWRNAQLGERVIMQLEEKSKQMSEEMDTAISNLNKEASDLELEKGRKAVS